MKTSEFITVKRHTKNTGLRANQTPYWVTNFLGYETTGDTKEEAIQRAKTAVAHLLTHWSTSHVEWRGDTCFLFVAIPDGFACIKTAPGNGITRGTKSFLGIPDHARSVQHAADIFFGRDSK